MLQIEKVTREMMVFSPTLEHMVNLCREAYRDRASGSQFTSSRWKIEAIKAIRNETKVGLKDAKDWVDGWFVEMPEPTSLGALLRNKLEQPRGDYADGWNARVRKFINNQNPDRSPLICAEWREDASEQWKDGWYACADQYRDTGQTPSLQ